MTSRLYLVVAAALVLPMAALAADLPSSKPAPIAAPSNPASDAAAQWSGFYLGLQAGYGFGQSQHTTPGYPDYSGHFAVDGGLVGGTLGYNFQSDAFVYGLEASLAYAAMSGSTRGIQFPWCPDGLNPDCTTKLQALATVAARIGYSIDRYLPYITGGVAGGQIFASSDPGGINSGTAFKIGYVVGAGIEAKIDSNWSVKAEYLYTDFGASKVFTRQLGNFVFDVGTSAQILRVGVNYRFGS